MRRLIEPSHLDICCLQKLVIISCSSERVNVSAFIAFFSTCITTNEPVHGKEGLMAFQFVILQMRMRSPLFGLQTGVFCFLCFA